MQETLYRLITCNLTKNCDLLQCVCGCRLYFCKQHHHSFYWFEEQHQSWYWVKKEGSKTMVQWFVPYEGRELANEIEQELSDLLLV